MYEDLAWKQFVLTGNVETFIEYKKLINQIYEKKGDITNETYQSQRNRDKRSSI